MIEPQDRLFKVFDLERVCLDKYFFVVYDKRYSMFDHEFDKRAAREYIQYVKKSRVKGKGRFVDVIRNEMDFSFYELHLSGSRHLFCYVNLIKFVQHKFNEFPVMSSVIFKDNFLPNDSKVLLTDFISAKDEVERMFKDCYYKLAFDLWGVCLEEIMIKPVQLEVAYEVFPCSVNDVSNMFDMNDVSFKRYNSQSGTIYLNENLGSHDVRLPEGQIIKINDDMELRDSGYVSNISGGYSSDKCQIKIYQKTFGLVRIEFSIVNNTIKKLNYYDDFISFLSGVIKDNLSLREYVKRFDISLDEVIKNVSYAVGITEEICYILKDVGTWESNRCNRSLRRKLLKKHLLVPIADDIGTKKKGKYKVAPWFKEIFTKFKQTGKELFLPELIKKR